MNKYQKQLNRVCKHFNIRINYIQFHKKGYEKYPLWASSDATTAMGIINIPRLNGPDAPHVFASALHEIGHCLEYWGRSPILKLKYEDQYFWSQKRCIVTKFRLDSEFNAWKIAQLLGGKIWNYECTAIRAIAMNYYILRFNEGHKKQSLTPFDCLPYFTEIYPKELLDPSFKP